MLAVFAGLLGGCSGTGLIQDNYPEEFYRVPKLLDETKSQAENPTFLIYGDNQAGWRVKEKFVRGHNWATWWQLALPVYQAYLLGNGLVGGVNYWRNAPDYGEDTRLMVRDAIYEEARRSQAAFILNVGDISAHDGRRPDHWALFLKENMAEFPLLREIPYLPVAGNHDRTNDPHYGRPNYEAIFDYPFFYTVNFPDLDLIIVDSNIIIDQKQEIDDDEQDRLFAKWIVSPHGSSEPAWLERELSRRQGVFKIVAMHHPPISYGFHRHDWLDPEYGRDLVNKKKQLLDLFQRSGVQVVFSGHDHVYQHFVVGERLAGRTTPPGPESSDLHLIVTTGGGTPIRERPSGRLMAQCEDEYIDQGTPCRIVKIESEYHYTRVNIEPSRMVIETFSVTGDPDRSGGLLDKLVFEK